MERDYRTVSLPKALVDIVQQLIENSGTYKSIAQFVAEATRLRVEELSKAKEGLA